MSDDGYRLPAHPKRTIREKQGSHRDLSNCRLDYSMKERAIYASLMEKKGRRVKEAVEAWQKRSCEKQYCFAIVEIKKDWSPTCRKIMQCTWAKNQRINGVRAWPRNKPRIVFTYIHRKH
jgi:hypothetical protein